MIGPMKLANKMCVASVPRMNSANVTSIGSKQASQAIPFLFELLYGRCRIVLWSMIVVSEAENFPFIVISSQMRRKGTM
jgi:hypothetical protein